MDFYFLKKPEICFNKNETFLSKITEFLLLTVILITIILVWSVVIGLISAILKYFDISFFEDIKTTQQKNIFWDDSYYFNIVKVLVLAPLFEELVFRFPMNLKKYSIITSLVVICIIFVGDKILNLSIYSIGTWLKLIIIVFIVVLGKLYLKKKYLNYIKNNYFKSYFYLSAIVFALIHIFNFSKVVPNGLILITPLFVLPQFFMAVIANYLRLKNGFIWALFLHVLFNLPVTLIYIAKSLLTFL